MPESPFINLSSCLLRQLADERSYERGEAYFRQGRVRGLAEFEGTLTATVRGTHDYRVKLWYEGEELEYSCTCPFAADGWFCKHCVAVGLMGRRVEGRGQARRAPTAFRHDG